MAKLSKKFVTLGLRADKNLSDVTSPESALNGLLNDLVNDPDPNKTFTSQDLNAIRGLQNTNINATKLSVLSGITVTASNPNGSLLPTEVSPLVRVVDRLENIKIITGEIPAIQGGNGLIATFIPSVNILPGETSSTGDTIFDPITNPVQEVFWDVGYFNFPSFIDPTFNDQYGGVQWEGYFTPALRDPSVKIYIDSTGLIMFEVDRNDNGTWETLLNIYDSEREIPFSGTANGNTEYIIGTSNVKFVSIGDTIDGIVAVTDVLTDRIVLAEPYVASGGTITASKVLGETITRNVVSLPSLEVGTSIKIRITYWFPNTGDDIREKYLEFDYIGSSLNYSYLYSEKPSNILGSVEIRKVLTDVISPFKNDFGSSSAYKNFYINNSSLLVYQPTMVSLNNIRKAGPGNITFTSGSKVISGSVLTNGVKGNILVPSDPLTTMTSILSIQDDISTTVRVVTNNPSLNGNLSVNIIEHKGFVGWYKATSSGTTVTLVSGITAELVSGFIVITNASASYIRIDQITGPSAFTTTTNLNLTGTEIIYVYSDRSLVDRSKEVFCSGVFGKVVTVTASQGTNVITVNNVVGVVVNQYIQFSGVISPDTQVVEINGNVLTINNVLEDELTADSTVVFVPESAGGTTNREGCVIPISNAPPFIGTDTGLASNNKNIKSSVLYQSFSVETENLSAIINSINITKPVTLDSTFNKKVLLKAKLSNQTRNFSVLSIKKP